MAAAEQEEHDVFRKWSMWMFAAVNRGAWDEDEAQRWFERWPMYLLEEPKRRKAAGALRSALKSIDDDKL